MDEFIKTIKLTHYSNEQGRDVMNSPKEFMQIFMETPIGIITVMSKDCDWTYDRSNLTFLKNDMHSYLTV